jgi:hypothetical protein
LVCRLECPFLGEAFGFLGELVEGGRRAVEVVVCACHFGFIVSLEEEHELFAVFVLFSQLAILLLLGI